MSPKFRKVHRPPLLPNRTISTLLSNAVKYLCDWCQFISDDLWNEMVCFQPSNLLIRKVWIPVMHFCAFPIHWRVDRRLGLCGLTPSQPLIVLTINEFSINSAQLVLEVL